MTKKIFAVTNIRHDGLDFAVGQEINPKDFKKEQLTALYDSGAVEVREIEVEVKESPVEPETEESMGPDTSVQKVEE